MIWAILKMMLALGFLLAVLVLGLKAFKKMGKGQTGVQPGAGINLLASKPIGPQKYVALVEIGSEILALGISAQSITFLTKIEDRETLKGSLGRGPFAPETLSWMKTLSPKGWKLGWFGAGNQK
jgi:flagellar biogenesis protein FliO